MDENKNTDYPHPEQSNSSALQNVDTAPMPANTVAPTISVPVQPAQPQLPPTTANIPVQAPLNVSELSYAGIDASMTDYLFKYSWLIAICLAVTVLAFMFVSTIFVIIIPILLITYLKAKYENSLFAAFAKANGFDFEKKGDPKDSLGGLVFTLGHGHRYSDIVSGFYKGLPFNLFMYKYTIGYGRGSHTYDRAVMSVNFATPLPPFFLRKHSMLESFDSDGESLNSFGYSQKVNLEGDFSKHFMVHIRPDSQVEVLAVLAPNVMELLMGLDKYEIEMTANGNFYVYCHGYIDKKQSLIDMYKILETVIPPIGRYAAMQQELHSR